MFLQISNPDSLELQDFCEWLITHIQNRANDSSLWNQDRVDAWTNYLHQYDFGWSRDVLNQPIVPSFAFIVDSYFSTLKVYKAGGSYYILADENRLLNSTEITVDSLASMINNGTVDMKGYPFFDEVFSFFAEHIEDYFSLYMDQQSAGE